MQSCMWISANCIRLEYISISYRYLFAITRYLVNPQFAIEIRYINQLYEIGSYSSILLNDKSMVVFKLIIVYLYELRISISRIVIIASSLMINANVTGFVLHHTQCGWQLTICMIFIGNMTSWRKCETGQDVVQHQKYPTSDCTVQLNY